MSNREMPEIPILYEDDDCLVVDKPAGLMVHPDGKSEGPFLTDWIISRYPQTKGVGEPANGQNGNPIDRSGIVHRLDRETSGAMIIAKTAKGYESLKKQFGDRKVTKKYIAFVWGEMKDEFGTIDRPIGRSKNNFRKWTAGRGARGEMREAETYWTRIWTGDVEDVGDKISLILVEPKTGRTHQIRVHFNAINHPVVGDSLYAPKRAPALGFARLALHAASLSFLSLSGRKIQVKSPLPADFLSAAKNLGLNLESLVRL